MPNETGFAFPWEVAAKRGYGMPDGLSLPDQMAFTAMRHIYFLYQNRTISRVQAASEKQMIRREYEKAIKIFESEDKMCRYHARLLRDTEAAKTTCRKSPTSENTLRLCDVLDGLEAFKNGPS